MTGVEWLLGGLLVFVWLIGLQVWRDDRPRHAHRKS
jgi:hypothetical protein